MGAAAGALKEIAPIVSAVNANSVERVDFNAEAARGV